MLEHFRRLVHMIGAQPHPVHEVPLPEPVATDHIRGLAQTLIGECQPMI